MYEWIEITIDLAAATYLQFHIDRIGNGLSCDRAVAIPSLSAETPPSALFSFSVLDSTPETLSWIESHPFPGGGALCRLAEPETYPGGRRPVGAPLVLHALRYSDDEVWIWAKFRLSSSRPAASVTISEIDLRLIQARSALLGGDPAYSRFSKHQNGRETLWWTNALVRSIAPQRLAHLSSERLGLILPPLFTSGDEKVREFANDVLALHRRPDDTPQHGGSRAREGGSNQKSRKRTGRV